jgi:predicted RNA-binding protein (virulence factor B family)
MMMLKDADRCFVHTADAAEKVFLGLVMTVRVIGHRASDGGSRPDLIPD